MKKFIRPYLGYALAYGSYWILLSLLNELFRMVDEVVDAKDAKNKTANNNNNELIDGTNDIVTTHDFNTCKEVVNIIKIRGGQNNILLRAPLGVIQGSF